MDKDPGSRGASLHTRYARTLVSMKCTGCPEGSSDGFKMVPKKRVRDPTGEPMRCGLLFTMTLIPF